MSEPFLKSLECSCIKATSATCPGGGEIDAFLSINGAVFSATLENDSKITSPGETITANFSVELDGAGPYFTISGCSDPDDSDNINPCDFVEAGWTATISGIAGALPFTVTANVVNTYADGSALIFYDGGIDLSNAQIDSVVVSGIGHPTPPNATMVKSFGIEGVVLEGEGEISRLLSAEIPFPPQSIEGDGEIDEDLQADYSLSQMVTGECDFSNTVDKMVGEFGDFYCQGKLYPSGDRAVADGFGTFIGKYNQAADLWNFIDEGVYEGVAKDGGDSNLLSDDFNSFIEPNTIHTEGLFQYNCELTQLNVRPDHSAFRVRVSAPLTNLESQSPPLYTLYNIRLLDPSGNLIIKYNDIQIKGDSSDEYQNFSTYSSLPEKNVIADKYDWERRGFPHMHQSSGYNLSFSVRAVSLDDPFDPGFDGGFEENYIIPETFYASGNNYLALDGQPLSTQEVRFINPGNNFRISAVEICNSGGLGPRVEDYLPFQMAVREKGRRLERCIKPKFMPLNTYDTTIYPAVNNNIWQDNRLVYTNEDVCGSQELINILQVNNSDKFITLQTAEGGDVADSGKLVLKFKHGVSQVDEITPGDFNFSFDQGTKDIWFSPSGAFNVEKRTENIQEDSIYFNVDTLSLKVLAKKAPGTRDYILDVVGYSDDKLLNVTSPSGGFIQDPSGVFLNDQFVPHTGQHPVLSGFYGNNSDWTMGGAGLSERDDYFESSGNDHYKLAQYPVVNTTDFQLYEVPLVILDDDVRYGVSRDYSLSSLLEHLYLDIYPLPSGASIAHIELCARYAPADGLNIYTQGGEKIGKAQAGRSEGALFPSSMESYDDILNAGSGYQPVSAIEGLPHAYSSPDTIKTNYSRRWRGSEGTVRGPYDLDAFSFGFENPTIDYPFLSGYYKFDAFGPENRYVLSVDMGPSSPSGLGTVSGLCSTEPEVYQNIGWRFASGTLFNDQLPGYSGQYTSTDWTALSNGSTTFVNNPMYGKIADAFDRVIRISGEAGVQNINFGPIDVSGGFAIFTRFTPDANVSGVDYNLFDSGVIVSKWSTAEDMDFALGYESGFLCGYAQDVNGNIIKVTDTIKYTEYQFPLNTILTYNDSGSHRLKLYTDNDAANPFFTVFRGKSSPFQKNATNEDLVLGYSAGSGVGMNMLVSEFGISTYSSGVDTLYGFGTNIVESGADRTYKGVTADVFLENSRAKFFNPNESYTNDKYKLWDRVNEDTYNDWAIGDFKWCQFGISFDQWQKRPNSEHIIFELKHHGSGYSQVNDLPLLSTVDSGVAYHTQMESDFLRFHLSDVQDSFYAVNRRITKNLPVGYKFSERALVVDTVIEHKTGSGIEWDACTDILPSGPKMIVSLYTKKQEPYWTSTEPNWGLVNRKTHYIKPSSCLIKLESVFDYDSLCDETEEWSIFPSEPRLRDFDERYFKDDVNQMFVQYDLVYPSGPAFDSRLEMHSSHVRMQDVNICKTANSGTMNLYSSGAYPAANTLNMNIGGFPREVNDSLDLTIQVPFDYDVTAQGLPSGFSLNISGAFQSSESLNLFIPPQSGDISFNLFVSGQFPDVASGSMPLNMPIVLGQLDNSQDGNPDSSNPDSPAYSGGRIFGLPMTVYNVDFGVSPEGPFLNLNMSASDVGKSSIFRSMPLYLLNKSRGNVDPISGSGLVNLTTFGRSDLPSTRLNHTMPLYINAPNIFDNNMNLYLHNPEIESLLSSTVNLVTASYAVGSKGLNGSAFGLWHNNNYGTGIELEDNSNAFLPADNEIRGVDLVGYGSCTGDSPSKAVDAELKTDCTVWREETCNEGGIFRAKATYTNSGAINFEGGLGYSGNYYGIRKYTQLLPSTPYLATMKIVTGSTDAIPVPRTFEEWEYGMCGPAWYEDGSGCCTEDCDGNIVFSGVKLIGDDAGGVPPSANLYPDPALILASGRNIGDNYGKTVQVSEDLLAVAAPNLTIPDYGTYPSGGGFGNIEVSGAGAVFLYRRGQDEAGKKADWVFQEQLMLPSGFRKDYIQRTTDNLLRFGTFSISGNKWQIGQEGRMFGESLSLSASGDREVIAVGAPRAKWSRQFDDIVTSGVPTAGMIFADLFSYNVSDLASVAGAAQRFNILYKYFSAPWNAGPDEWYAEISPNLLVFQLTYSDRNYPNIPTDNSSWFTHRYIPRLDDLDLLEAVGSGALGGSGTLADFIASGQPIVFDQMFSGVMDGFFTAFPSGNSEVSYSGIPAIVGMFKEQTGSTAGALQYADANGTVYNIYDRFEEFYLKHSFASGVTDFVQGIPQSGHLNTVVGKSENWATTSISLMEDTFDSGRLSTTFTNSTLNRNFITSGVGQIWGDTHGSVVTEFQVPPASGGRVYIFEKERENFNCVQVIVSPADEIEISDVPADIFGAGYGKTFNDRFGHSVALSKNSQVLAIGSPWRSDPCKIYERDETEFTKVYQNLRNWLVRQGQPFQYAVDHYDTIEGASGTQIAQISTYDYIKSPDRFEYRNDVTFWGNSLPSPYKLTFQYGNNNIKYIGTRKFLVDEFAPTSRLGWSCAVDEDGEIVAFGAPTDSFNEFEDINVWGDTIESWASYHNAGAVRMFHNRKYFPHSDVVEFGRFGNLDRSTHDTERDLGYYDESNWPLIFGSGADGTTEYQGRDWRRMDFSEIEIPQEAGLAFIITPEVDAASDEIIDNIKDWLELGDRNLVLVGNDPVWEDNGLYKESNDVINKILQKLGSRMRIHAAKDQTYSMQGCVSQEDLTDKKYNATASFLPAYSTQRSIEHGGQYYVKGVGDIRIDLSRDGLSNFFSSIDCPDGASCNGPPQIINTKCEFPLKGASGDLRAEWNDSCVLTTPTSCTIVRYQRNWPFLFNNFTPTCDETPQPLFRKQDQSPTPVLTTAEHLPDIYWFNPATSGEVCDYIQYYKYRVRRENETEILFTDTNIDEVAFSIEEDESSNIFGIFNDFTIDGDMVDPDATNGRDALIQGVGKPLSFTDSRNITETIYPDHIMALVESGKKADGSFNNSRVYIIGTQWSEDDNSRGITAATLNDDKNTEFYLNMIRKNCNEVSRGIQINGFTGRSSLSDAYSASLTPDVLVPNYSLGKKINVELLLAGGYFRENQSMSDLNDQIDFAWLAFPSGKPSNSDLGALNSWLETGDKKLIITYNATQPDDTQKIADRIDYLCSGLNITSRPLFKPRAGVYHSQSVIGSWVGPEGYQVANYETDSVSGCDNGYAWAFPNYQFATSLSGVDFNNGFTSIPDTDQDPRRQLVPLSGGSDFERIISFDRVITQTYTEYSNRNEWVIDGASTIKFPIQPGSGYRMWVNYVSENNFEDFSMCFNSNTTLIRPDSDEGQVGGFDFDVCGNLAQINRTPPFTPAQLVIDFRTNEDSLFENEELELGFNTSKWSTFIDKKLLEDRPLPPVTPRILSISGALLPLETIITTTVSSGLVPDGPPVKTNCQWIVNPATSGYIPGESRPVKHESSIYCDDITFGTEECVESRSSWETQEIEDGPVIVAEEFENFSAFTNGARRSKIILISDSTLLQGQCPHYRAETIGGNQAFIRGLYPNNPKDVLGDDGDGFGGGGGAPQGQAGGFNLNFGTAINAGKNWEFTQKLRAPERGSTAKYVAISGQSIGGNTLSPSRLWGGNGVNGGLAKYYDNEDTYDPTTLSRPQEIRDQDKIRKRKKEFFDTALSDYGVYPRFSGDLLDIVNYKGLGYAYYDELLDLPPNTERDFIVDAGIGGGLTELMKIENTDYLDYDIFNSGCPGDLFGYSIEINDGKLIVGTPYNAFATETAISGVGGIVQWHEIKNGPSASGAKIGADGGAGAAFIYNNTNNGRNVVSEGLPWEFGAKLKPENINVGLYDFSPSPIEVLTAERGPHQIVDPSFILEYARRGDRFGFSVSVDCDMAAIGAPNHDFATLHHHIYSGSVDPNGLNTAFQRKSFNGEYDIPFHSFYDLADSGIRVDQFNNNSGLMILNGGAVYNYRNELVDFGARTQEWQFAEKLYAAGHQERVQTDIDDDGFGGFTLNASGSDNDNFGRSVAIYRSFRGDSDYTLGIGSPYHDWPTSGNHPTSGLADAGSAYTFDCMLRQQIPAIPNSGGWIDAHVFGHKKLHSETDRLDTRVYQNTSGNPEEYSVSGIIFSNQNGDIFLEVSGFDPSRKGFVAHRPYVKEVDLKILFGTPENGSMNLVASGRPVLESGNMNLSMLGADRANVYNSLGLNNFGVSGIASADGIDQSGLFLNISAPSGPLPSSLNLVMGSTQTTDSLDLRIRGF
jgi:hypothetical protein